MIELPPGKILGLFARHYHWPSSYFSSFLQTPPRTGPPIVNLTIPLAFLALHFSTQNAPSTSPVRPPSTLPYPIPPAIVLLHPELHNTGRRIFNSQKGTKIPTLLFYPHLPLPFREYPPQPPPPHSPALHTIPTSRPPFPSRLARPTNLLPQHRSRKTAGPP